VRGVRRRGVDVRARSCVGAVRCHPHHAVERVNYSPLLTPDESGRRARPRLVASVGPTARVFQPVAERSPQIAAESLPARFACIGLRHLTLG
jgi:hypothetical protein